MMEHIPTIIVVVAAFAAVVALLMALGTLRRALRQRAWRETPAEIVASEVSSRLAPRSGEGPQTQFGRMFKPEVRFVYEIAGQRHESKTHSLFVNESSSDSEAAAVVAHYPVGAKVTAYVDPGNPAAAVLDRSIRWSTLLVMLGVCCVFATVAVVLGLRLR
ncbi:MAG: DUF3592 domain-containing protein [Deltaproteobacteria bacterium]|nr:DUF3592 domain-containing protein [Deltaproteobacteria bacterium]